MSVNFKPSNMPCIAAFNSGSLGYLCNFNLDEIQAVIDSTIFQPTNRKGNKLTFSGSSQNGYDG